MPLLLDLLLLQGLGQHLDRNVFKCKKNIIKRLYSIVAGSDFRCNTFRSNLYFAVTFLTSHSLSLWVPLCTSSFSLPLSTFLSYLLSLSLPPSLSFFLFLSISPSYVLFLSLSPSHTSSFFLSLPLILPLSVYLSFILPLSFCLSNTSSFSPTYFLFLSLSYFLFLSISTSHTSSFFLSVSLPLILHLSLFLSLPLILPLSLFISLFLFLSQCPISGHKIQKWLAPIYPLGNFPWIWQTRIYFLEILPQLAAVEFSNLYSPLKISSRLQRTNILCNWRYKVD